MDRHNRNTSIGFWIKRIGGRRNSLCENFMRLQSLLVWSVLLTIGGSAFAQDCPFGPTLPTPAVVAALQNVNVDWVYSEDGQLIGANFEVELRRKMVTMDDLKVLWRHEPKLKILRFPNHAKVTDEWMVEVAKFQQLEELSLVDSQVTDEGLSKLRKLSLIRARLSENERLTDKAMETVADWEKLKTLDLFNLPNLTDEGVHTIRGLASLEELILANNELTDKSVEVLQGFKKLKYLGIGANFIEFRSYEAIQDALPNCKVNWSYR